MSEDFESLVDPIRVRAAADPRLAGHDVLSPIRSSVRLLQIDLAKTPSVDDALPKSGRLYFFYDRSGNAWGGSAADRGSWRVLFADGDRSRLVRTEPPADLDKAYVAEPCEIEARLEPTLPDDGLPGIDRGSAACEAYWDLCQELNDGEPVQHRLLGHAQVIQNPMELDCQLASNGIDCGSLVRDSDQARQLADGARDWRLLLQIDSDEAGPGWRWVDLGRIYFWIRDQDLRSLRFDDVWLILQAT